MQNSSNTYTTRKWDLTAAVFIPNHDGSHDGSTDSPLIQIARLSDKSDSVVKREVVLLIQYR